MSYDTYAALRSGKTPAWLYEITFDGTTNYLAQGRDYTLGGQLYTGTTLYRTNIVSTQDAQRAAVNVTFPRTNALARQIRDYSGLDEVGIKIREVFKEDPDQEALTLFDGRVVSAKPKLPIIILTCEDHFTEARRKSLSAVMQKACRHAHYHGGCGLDINGYNVAATATDYSGDVLTVTEAALQADGHYAGGIVTFGGVPRMIMEHTGSALTLLDEMPGLADDITANGTSSVSIAPACARNMSDCHDKFGNILNFGGFPWMDEAPFDGRQGRLMWASLFRGVFFAIVAYLLTPEPPVPEAPEKLENVPRAKPGDDIVEAFGSPWIKSPQVAWYGDFEAVPIKGDKK